MVCSSGRERCRFSWYSQLAFTCYHDQTACSMGLRMIYSGLRPMHSSVLPAARVPESLSLVFPWLPQASVASYNDKLDRLNGDDETRTSIVERLKMFDDQLEGIKAEEQEAREKLTALQQKEEKKYEDIPALKEVRRATASCCITRAVGGAAVGTLSEPGCADDAFPYVSFPTTS